MESRKRRTARSRSFSREREEYSDLDIPIRRGEEQRRTESKYTVERILMRKQPTITREDRGEVKAKGGKGRKAIF